MATQVENKSVPTIAADVVEGNLVLTFANGEVLTVDPTALSDDIRYDAVLHGLKQKLVDAAAIARNPDNGKSATIDDKYNAVKEVFDRITSTDGTWNKQRGDGTGASTSGVLVRALMELTGKDKAAIEAFLDAKSKEEKAALRTNPKVAAIIAKMQSKKTKVDSDGLLGELM